jgi:WD40-like Beta Propeller Repeat
VLLRGEMGSRARVYAAVLGAAAVLSVNLAAPAHASAARHYEEVSPPDKGLGDIIGDGATNIAARGGDAVTLSTRTPFGDTVGSGVSGQTQYVVRRSQEGWRAHAITPQPRSDAYQTVFGPTRFEGFSEDLRDAVVWAYDLPGATDDVPLRNNIYVEDTATLALRTVTLSSGGLPDPLPHPFELADDFTWGVSADAQHVAFVSRVPFLAEAAVGGVPNVYQWDDGVLSLAGILPNGTVPAGGSDVVAAWCPEGCYGGSMSADGTRLVFVASSGGNRQLYMRIGGRRTVWISEPEVEPRDPDLDPSSVSLRSMTPDGRNVFFTTDTALLNEDTNGGTDLYRWTDSADPSRDANLTIISQDGDIGGGELIGTSNDGQRVYYHTASDVIVGWDHGAAHLVTAAVTISGDERERLGPSAWGPGLGRVTPDGIYLAFASSASQISPEGPVGPTGEVTNRHREMYLYRLGGVLRCISCPAGPATTDVTVLPEVTSGVPSYFIPGLRPRFLSDRGQVFFSTGEALVSEDVNGVADTYEYDPGTASLSLLSSGKGSDPAMFTNASASGDDVFIVTRQRFVASDNDDLVDLYDARVGSALSSPAENPAPACEGESCQPPPSTSPADDLLGSLTFDERGAGPPRGNGLAVRRRLVVRGATGVLRLTLSAPGTLRWSGRGLRRGSVRRSRAGTVVLRLRLTRAARAQLGTAGAYTTSVRLTLTSAGEDVSKRTRVTFKPAAKKGR